jgi:formate dehydrogenase maturation protein FdhE
MDPWQRRIERAEALARRFPFSAELMYFYRDIVRFQAGMEGQDVTPLRGFSGELGAFFDRVVKDPPAAPNHCGHAGPRIYSDAEFPHIRVEACDTCGMYRKVIEDPSAIFEVDDLASVPLDIWAVGNGYRKVTPNLFGL